MLRIVTPPANEPVSRDDAKLFSGIDTADFDTMIDAFITASRKQIENKFQRTYVTTVWEWVRRDWPDVIRLPLAPVQSVQFIKYVDANGVQQTLDPSLYIVRESVATKEIVASASYYWGWGPTGFFPAPLLPWPWPVLGPAAEPIVIRFTAGHLQDGGNTDPVPENVCLAIKMMVDWLFHNRGGAASDAIKALDDVVMALCAGEAWD